MVLDFLLHIIRLKYLNRVYTYLPKYRIIKISRATYYERWLRIRHTFITDVKSYTRTWKRISIWQYRNKHTHICTPRCLIKFIKFCKDYLCECTYASSYPISGEIFSHKTRKDMVSYPNELTGE